MGTLVFSTPEESIKNLFHLPESKKNKGNMNTRSKLQLLLEVTLAKKQKSGLRSCENNKELYCTCDQ